MTPSAQATPEAQTPARGSDHALSVAIIGGGIAGVALGIGLANHDHLKVDLFESAERFGEVGAGVSFGPNAVRAVAGLGLEKEYLALADRTPEPWQDIWFDWRFADDGRHIASSVAAPTGQSSVHRAEFLELLAARLPAGTAHFSKRAKHVERHGMQSKVTFTDGTSHIADLIIVADGIKSALRPLVLQGRGKPAANPVFSGTRAYRGMVDTAALRAAFVSGSMDPRMVDVPQMFLAQNIHILTFPVRHGALINIVAFITRPEDRDWPADMPWVRETTKQEMLADFSCCGDAVRVILDSIERPTIWALHDIPEIEAYIDGNVALIGDAAHAMLPHQGAGAGQGLEDAYFFSELLGDPSLQASDVPRLLAAYENVRLPRACAVQRTSREAGDLYEFRSAEAGSDPAALKQLLETRFDWIWNHDLDSDVTAARQLLSDRKSVA
ncbi:salicylate hydroxylase [Pseudoxanthomonas sp. GM95]|nr:salicylate hydroxylase [Pseudoxanthomonas sp. GM95]